MRMPVLGSIGLWLAVAMAPGAFAHGDEYRDPQPGDPLPPGLRPPQVPEPPPPPSPVRALAASALGAIGDLEWQSALDRLRKDSNYRARSTLLRDVYRYLQDGAVGGIRTRA